MNLTRDLRIKGDWEEVVDDCRATVRKNPLGRKPSSGFKKEILISEHSPIRGMSAKWKWLNIPHWVGVHWVRHKWECFVSTQRSDRTGVQRDKLPQDTPQDFTGEANIQHTIDTWRKRLCRQASQETREYAEDFKKTLRKVEPEWADVLVPNCVYRCGCPEIKNCGWYDRASEKNQKLKSTNIQERYDAYNEGFYNE